jgi:hypothetical protein
MVRNVFRPLDRLEARVVATTPGTSISEFCSCIRCKG